MEDREMSLTEHLEELRVRVLKATIAVVASATVIFVFSGRIISILWKDLLNYPPYVFSPLEWLILQINVSLLLAVVICYPYIAYELYMFAKPGLYEHERRFLKIVIVPSYLVFLAANAISLLFIVPELYRLAISQGYDPYLSAARTIDGAVKLGIAFGIFSQIPLAMFLAVKFGITSYETLKNARFLFYLAVIAVVTNFSADLSFFAQIAAAGVMVVMYEIGLVALRIARSINRRVPATA